jgi:hypothetical protein
MRSGRRGSLSNAAAASSSVVGVPAAEGLVAATSVRGLFGGMTETPKAARAAKNDDDARAGGKRAATRASRPGGIREKQWRR